MIKKDQVLKRPYVDFSKVHTNEDTLHTHEISYTIREQAGKTAIVGTIVGSTARHTKPFDIECYAYDPISSKQYMCKFLGIEIANEISQVQAEFIARAMINWQVR